MSSIGGTPIQICIQAKTLTEMGHEVHIFALGELNPRLEMGAAIFHKAGEQADDLMHREYAALELANYILKINAEVHFDIFMAHYPCAMFACAINKAITGTPFIILLHGTEQHLYLLDQFQFYATSIGISLASQVIAVSKKCKEEFLSTFPEIVEKMDVITDAIYCSHISQKRIQQLNKQIHQKDKNSFLFGFIGRMCEQKGVKELLEAFTIVLQKHDCKLILIGEGSLDRYIDDYIQNHNLFSNIIKKGFVNHNEVYEYLSVLDSLVLPSHHEGLGTIVLESLYCGTPVLASKVGGIPEIIQEGYNGLLFSPYSIEGIKNSMITIIEDAILFRELKHNALESVANYKIESVVCKILSSCHKAIDIDNTKINNLKLELNKLYDISGEF